MFKTPTSQMTLGCLKVISINVNSIAHMQKRSSLSKLLHKLQPDIVLLNETKLNSRHKIEFKNYTAIRQDRPHSTKGGGVAILIKHPIKFEQINENCHSAENKLEIIIIKIKLKHNENLIIASAYAAF